MTNPPDLTGQHVLVVEDEYFIATDTVRALQGAGADVMGPCPNATLANSEIARQRPDVVVVDINLGRGPSFELAESLQQRGIPFLFMTGYDEDTIPAEFDDVERLLKPVELRHVVEAVSRLAKPAV